MACSVADELDVVARRLVAEGEPFAVLCVLTQSPCRLKELKLGLPPMRVQAVVSWLVDVGLVRRAMHLSPQGTRHIYLPTQRGKDVLQRALQFVAAPGV